MKRIGVVGNPGAWSSERMADTVEQRTGFRCLIDLAELRLDLERGGVWQGDLDLTTLDALIIKKVGNQYTREHLDRLELLRYVAARGVPVFSDPQRIMGVLNRLTCTVTLRLHDIPMPPTVITESVSEAVATVERFGRAIVKPHFSSKARGMKVLEAGNGLAAEIAEFKADGHPLLYIQQFKELPGKDLGLAFLGGEYVGTYARVGNKDSWNTTIRAGGKYEAYEPAPEIIALARKAQAPFGLAFTSVDVAECADGPIIFEVSAFGGFRGLLEGNGIDAAGLYLDHVLEQIGHE